MILTFSFELGYIFPLTTLGASEYSSHLKKGIVEVQNNNKVHESNMGLQSLSSWQWLSFKQEAQMPQSWEMSHVIIDLYIVIN